MVQYIGDALDTILGYPHIISECNQATLIKLGDHITDVFFNHYVKGDLGICRKPSVYTKKGMLIFGDYGRGKTVLLKALFKALNKTEFRRSSGLCPESEFSVDSPDAIRNFRDISNQVRIDGNTRSLIKFQKYPLGIDDLGFRGKTSMKIYGEEIDLVEEIIYSRHSAFMDDQNRTYMTSNLTPEIIKERYGEGLYSRLVEMCEFYYWGGENFRFRGEDKIRRLVSNQIS